MKCIVIFSDLTTFKKTKYRSTALKWQEKGHEVVEYHYYPKVKIDTTIHWEIKR